MAAQLSPGYEFVLVDGVKLRDQTLLNSGVSTSEIDDVLGVSKPFADARVPIDEFLRAADTNCKYLFCGFVGRGNKILAQRVNGRWDYNAGPFFLREGWPRGLQIVSVV